MTDEDPPAFDDGDHAILWEKVHENSEAIAVLKSDMDWTKRILTGTLATILITLITLILASI